MAISLPAAGLLAAHQSAVTANSGNSRAAAGLALASFSTIATGLLNAATAPVRDASGGKTIVKFGAGVYGAIGYESEVYTVPTP